MEVQEIYPRKWDCLKPARIAAAKKLGLKVAR
jgi:hypothetical protein